MYIFKNYLDNVLKIVLWKRVIFFLTSCAIRPDFQTLSSKEKSTHSHVYHYFQFINKVQSEMLVGVGWC